MNIHILVDFQQEHILSLLYDLIVSFIHYYEYSKQTSFPDCIHVWIFMKDYDQRIKIHEWFGSRYEYSWMIMTDVWIFKQSEYIEDYCE